MRTKFTILFLFIAFGCSAQSDVEKLTTTMKEFHQALVNKNTASINQQTDKALSFGHSNGWIQTKTDVINDLETGYIVYHSYKEDSISIVTNGNMANVRFIGDINASLKGNTVNNHLKVLEVWVKKGNRWILFARQAVK